MAIGTVFRKHVIFGILRDVVVEGLGLAAMTPFLKEECLPHVVLRWMLKDVVSDKFCCFLKNSASKNYCCRLPHLWLCPAFILIAASICWLMIVSVFIAPIYLEHFRCFRSGLHDSPAVSIFISVIDVQQHVRKSHSAAFTWWTASFLGCITFGLGFHWELH